MKIITKKVFPEGDIRNKVDESIVERLLAALIKGSSEKEISWDESTAFAKKILEAS